MAGSTNSVPRRLLSAFRAPHEVFQSQCSLTQIPDCENPFHCFICLQGKSKMESHKSAPKLAYDFLTPEQAGKICELLRLPYHFFVNKLQLFQVCSGCHEKIKMVMAIGSKDAQNLTTDDEKSRELIVAVRTFLASQISRFYFPIKMEDFGFAKNGNCAINEQLYFYFLRRLIIDEIRTPKTTEEFELLDLISICKEKENKYLASLRCLICLEESRRNHPENPLVKLNVFEISSLCQVLELHEQSKKTLEDSLVCLVCHKKLVQIPHLLRELNQVSSNLVSAKNYVRAEFLRRSTPTELQNMSVFQGSFLKARQELEQELKKLGPNAMVSFEDLQQNLSDDDQNVTVIELEDGYEFSEEPKDNVEIIDDDAEEINEHTDKNNYPITIISDFQDKCQNLSIIEANKTSCRYCWMTFQCEDALMLHEKFHHSSSMSFKNNSSVVGKNPQELSFSGRKFTCELCPSYVCGSLKELWDHQKLHNLNHRIKIEPIHHNQIFDIHDEENYVDLCGKQKRQDQELDHNLADQGSSRTQNFSSNQLHDFNSDQRRNLSSDQLRNFNSGQLQNFNPDQRQSLSSDQLRNFNSDQLQNFNSDQLQDFDSSRIPRRTRRTRSFQCYICKRKYLSGASLQKHIFDSHCKNDNNIITNNPQSKKCERCHRIFPTSRSLAVHMRTHLKKAGGAQNQKALDGVIPVKRKYRKRKLCYSVN